MELKVHVCKLFNPTAVHIRSLSVESDLQKLALTRSDSSVEVWDCHKNLSFLKSYSCSNSGTMECVVWCQKRIFCGGSEGVLFEFSLHSSTVQNFIKVSVSPIICMASSPKNDQIAVGCRKEGVILVEFDDSNKPIITNKFLRQKGVFCNNTHVVYVYPLFNPLIDRVQSMAWQEQGKLLVTGSVSNFRIWNVQTLQCLQKVSVCHSTGKKTRINALKFINDYIVVSGDTAGRTSFWDINRGILIESKCSHKSSVQAVCVEKASVEISLVLILDTGYVYTSGIDSLICQYQCMETTESSRKRNLDGETKLADLKKITFIESRRQRFQPTTVGSLVKENSWLLSAGVGATMYQIMDNGERHLYKPFHPVKLDNVKCLAESNIVLFNNRTHLEVWRLGATAEDSDVSGTVLPLSKTPEKLLILISKKDKPITCCALGNTKQAWSILLAYSDTCNTNILFVVIKDDHTGLKVSLKKLKMLNAKLQPADALCFINVKSTEICVIAANGVLSFVAIEKFRLSLKFKIELTENSLCSVRKLVQSWDDRFLAAVTSHNDILVIDVTTKSIIRAPNKALCPVDLKFSSEKGTVVILFSSGHILEFSPNTRKCTPLCKSDILQPRKVPQWSKDCLGIAASKHLPNTVILYGDKKLSFVRKNSQNILQAVESVSQYGNCCFCDIMSDGELLVVQIDKDRYNAQLPALFKLQKFGRK
ncbi:Cirhin [Trichinella pseudospiralis]|uniref:Cirhin n=1 Tax=Trichinella pseudospiralis TaxID=6337 RepID=A0A0V1K9H1_TRIPS|nr:Cirhin [Trichinella pseudospiralis]